MTERVLTEDYPAMPIDEDIPLAHLNPASRHGLYDGLYTMDTPEYAERYIVRRMGFIYLSTARNLSRAEQYDIYSTELDRLKQCGIAVPQVYAGLPEDHETIVPNNQYDRETTDIMLVAERITPLEVTDDNASLARQQAKRTLTGLITYLQSSWTPERREQGIFYLDDVFGSHQYIYGTPPGSDQPDFYMIDVEAHVDDCVAPSLRRSREINILDTARYFAELTDDLSLFDHAYGLLYGDSKTS